MTRTVAVGFGGAGGSQALAWASEEALQITAPLQLLRSCPRGSPLARRPGTPPMAQVELVDPPLARAVSAARARLGSRRVSLRILEGDPGTALAHASTGAGMLVIGAGGGGSTVRRVIRHAHCPVKVHSTVLHGGVCSGLIWAGAGAHLLVVGERHRGPLGRARTGDVPPTVARRARCPVAVVPVDRREGDPW